MKRFVIRGHAITGNAIPSGVLVDDLDINIVDFRFLIEVNFKLP